MTIQDVAKLAPGELRRRESASYDRLNVRLGSVSFQRASANRKLTVVDEQEIPGSRFRRPIPKAPFCSSTYVSIQATCPSSCRFKDAGCYVQAGITGARARGLDHAATEAGQAGDDVLAHEAAVIDAQWPGGVPQDGARGGRDLRLHVGGDVSSVAGARILAAAADRWRTRGGGAVWTYTHRWAEIPIEAWGSISVWASCESREEVLEAHALGYQPSITLKRFPSERRFRMKRTGLDVIPCPAQTRGVSCVQCRLCLDRPLGLVVGFAIHGKGKNRASLPVLMGDYIGPVDDVDLERLTQAQARAAASMGELGAMLLDTSKAVRELREAMLAAGISPEDLDAEEQDPPE